MINLSYSSLHFNSFSIKYQRSSFLGHCYSTCGLQCRLWCAIVAVIGFCRVVHVMRSVIILVAAPEHDNLIQIHVPKPSSSDPCVVTCCATSSFAIMHVPHCWLPLNRSWTLWLVLNFSLSLNPICLWNDYERGSNSHWCRVSDPPNASTSSRDNKLFK